GADAGRARTARFHPGRPGAWRGPPQESGRIFPQLPHRPHRGREEGGERGRHAPGDAEEDQRRSGDEVRAWNVEVSDQSVSGSRRRERRDGVEEGRQESVARPPAVPRFTRAAARTPTAES